jgi:hypothetical protein
MGSMKTKSRFQKGQTVYLACHNFASIHPTPEDYRKAHGCEEPPKDIAFGVVVSRVVDACGQKQVTFYDHGNDSIYGRSRPVDFPGLFETHQEAADFLKGMIPRLGLLVDKREHSDADSIQGIANELKDNYVLDHPEAAHRVKAERERIANLFNRVSK